MVVGLAVVAGPPGAGPVDDRDAGIIVLDGVLLDIGRIEEVDIDGIIDGEELPTVGATAEEVDPNPATGDEGGGISKRIAAQTSIFGVIAPRLILG